MEVEKSPGFVASANSPSADAKDVPTADVVINASGHAEVLDRNFSLFSIVSLAITSGNTWITLGGSITVAIYNGGPPGIIYEFIAVSVLYWLVAASIAELASAMPSSGGIYHWASITAGRYGRSCGFFAGWWNFLAWIFGLASTLQILSAQLVSMYALMHPDFVTQRWHVFLTYVITTWITCAIVLFFNRALPRIEQLGGFLILAGVFITVVVCAVMPSTNGNGHATSASVWRDWTNTTGYSSDGFVFLAGMLNGAFAVGTPDITSHLAEEIPRQFVVGFFTALFYIIAMLYAITNLDEILTSTFLFPLTAIYQQATGSAGGALGLLVVVFLPTFISVFGVYLTASRVFWTLARDNATPFSGFFGRVNEKTKNPFNSIVLCAVISTVLGCIYIGSSTAFSAFVGSFCVLGFFSYLAPILPHLLGGRNSVAPGPFWMGRVGFVVNAISCLFIIAFSIIFCFPFSLPVAAPTMNYASLISGGLTIFVAAFWFWRQKDYIGPRYVPLDAAELAKDAI
ncbi:hypothetical protein LTR04_004013 [Oleoguttula sp. CCFEE 6159]|nr:hypothetical protein LTR04_004013 [Oleoguttula sp. CCFEE 6159]